MNSKNNGQGLLLKVIFKPWSCFVASFVKDGKDWDGLKLEKAGLTFLSFNAMPEVKNHWAKNNCG